MKFSTFINEYAELESDEISLSPEDYKDFEEFLNSLDSDTVDSLGVVLYSYFADDDEELDGDIDYEFTVQDVLELANAIGPDVINVIDLINDEEDFNYDEIFEYLDSVLLSDEVNEKISRRMAKANMLKSRKFQKLTRAQLRVQSAKRRSYNRKNRIKARRNRRKNKRKIAMYQKSRAQAIKSGKHIVRLRR